MDLNKFQQATKLQQKINKTQDAIDQLAAWRADLSSLPLYLRDNEGEEPVELSIEARQKTELLDFLIARNNSDINELKAQFEAL